jgi:Zn finger protein HypA/HybF involved in hydrogenase expression
MFKITLLFFMLVASVILLFNNDLDYWGYFFGFVFFMALVLIAVNVLTLPVVKERFFSAILTRKMKEAVSEDKTSLVLERANHKCQNCGEPGNKIYHIDREKSHHDMNNLICLCAKCLARIEDGRIPKSQLYFMRLK